MLLEGLSSPQSQRLMRAALGDAPTRGGSLLEDDTSFGTALPGDGGWGRLSCVGGTRPVPGILGLGVG